MVGHDAARALAVLGMVVVHFSLVAAADRGGPAWLAAVLGLLDGRAAATFVVLAGVGITLLSRRAVTAADPVAPAAVRRTLTRRGVFPLAAGFVNLVVRPGDILRVYGVALLVSSRLLLALAGGFVAVFVVLVLVGDFE